MSVPERLPRERSLPALREAAAGCQACDLWRGTTQTVFGEGPPDAQVVLAGEQPGDQEDRQGHPFVGPAGSLLHRALEEAGVDPAVTYFTNVVKHFKWRPQGKRRIHQRPDRAEVDACLPWLEAELEALRPKLLVCLGSSAARALLGSGFRVTQHRGEVVRTDLEVPALITVHPSSVLRAPDDEARHQAHRDFVEDLGQIAAAVR
jgi:uracil-DNA glycosylase